MAKHAFLIIAHNEFEILKLLVSSLDDERNDIFVHIDKKVDVMPSLQTQKSRLFVLTGRMDVRWGNYTQILCEYLLWEAALKNGPYEFYHLISGTHLPLKCQDEIHEFFEINAGMNMFCNLERRDRDYQEILKLHRMNLFTRTYASKSPSLSKISQFLWKSFIALQRWLKITVNDKVQFYWANNWCSLCQEAVEFLVREKKRIIRRYRWSFCGDEWFVPTELMDSEYRDKVVNSDILLFGSIGKSNATVLTLADYDSMIHSNCLFARKFTEKDRVMVEVVSKLLFK